LFSDAVDEPQLPDVFYLKQASLAPNEIQWEEACTVKNESVVKATLLYCMNDK
jgi:hypothetical protein